MPIVKTERFKEYIRVLRKTLPEARVSHCIFVAEYIASFAESIGVDHDKAVTAGLLHDLCRTLDNATMLARAQEYGIPVSATQADRPMILHGPVAAAECANRLGIEDAEICEAIACHTTGKAGFGRLAQALYVADYAEPTRKYPEAAQTREILRHEGFDEALYYVATQKVTHVREKGILDPATEHFYLWIQEHFG
ncbi:MAG: bis(5'-nucleosyl)-tetraphosphatase (symmetrical) YqeK [Candidatus Hydrogenedentes bacterium]|nr:bis(5'-nucleosyl)-tetraphosphatase (symmetrical) YqeK [Candidatus Hydrogenedentota bacterium]